MKKAILWLFLAGLVSICTSCSWFSFLRPQDIKLVEDVGDDVLKDIEKDEFHDKSPAMPVMKMKF